MATATAPSPTLDQEVEAAADQAPQSELDAARARVASLTAAFEARYGRSITVTGERAVDAARTIRSVARQQAGRR